MKRCAQARVKKQNRGRGERLRVFEARRGRVMCHITHELSHGNAAFPKSQSRGLGEVRSQGEVDVKLPSLK